MIEENYKAAAERLVNNYESQKSGAFPIDGLYLDGNVFYFIKDAIFILDETGSTVKDNEDARTYYTTIGTEATKLYAERNNLLTAPLKESPSSGKVKKSAVMMANEIYKTLQEVLVASPNAIEVSFNYHDAEVIVNLKGLKKFRLKNKPSDARYAHALMLATDMLNGKGETDGVASAAAKKGTAIVKSAVPLDPKARVLSQAKAAYEKGMFSKEHFPIFGVYVVFDTLNFTVPAAYEKHPFLKDTCRELDALWQPLLTELKESKTVFTQYEVFRELGLM